MKRFLLIKFTFILTFILNISKEQSASNLNSGCNYNNCPYSQGVCYNNKCVCSNHYKTIIDENSSNQIFCNYEEKSKITAFLLEFFFPFGAGHFYALNLGKAFFKFGIFIFIFMFFCLELCCITSAISKGLVCASFFLIVLIATWLAAQIIDILGYLLNIYTDGYNLPLY